MQSAGTMPAMENALLPSSLKVAMSQTDVMLKHVMKRSAMKTVSVWRMFAPLYAPQDGQTVDKSSVPAVFSYHQWITQ
jgi:predicted solute-binding protein